MRAENYGHKLAFGTGGYPLSTDSFLGIEKAWRDIEERLSTLLFADDDTYVVTGCTLQSGTNRRSGGLLVLHGRLYQYLPSSGDYLTAGYFEGLPDEYKATYQDGTERQTHYRYYAVSVLDAEEWRPSATDPADGENRMMVCDQDLNTPWSSVPTLSVRLRQLATSAGNGGNSGGSGVDLSPIYDALADLETMLNDGLRNAGQELSDLTRDVARTYATKAELTTERNERTAADTRFQTALNEEQTRRGTTDEQLDSRITQVRQNLEARAHDYMPKGGIVLYSQELPLWASSLAQITEGVQGSWPALPYGYLPCADHSYQECTTDTLNAWTAYIRDLGFNIPTLNNLNFPALSSAIGLTIPDLGGRFPLGVGRGHWRGRTGGSETQTLTVQQMPEHTHDIHQGNDITRFAFAEQITYSGGNNAALRWVSADQQLAQQHPTTIESTGGGESFSILPPFLALHYLIKVI